MNSPYYSKSPVHRMRDRLLLLIDSTDSELRTREDKLEEAKRLVYALAKMAAGCNVGASNITGLVEREQGDGITVTAKDSTFTLSARLPREYARDLRIGNAISVRVCTDAMLDELEGE